MDPAPSQDPDQLITRQYAADLLGLQEQTLRAWASRCPERLPPRKIGGAVRYRLGDVIALRDHQVA